MKGGTGRGAQCFWREGARRSGLSGGGGYGDGGAEGGGRADDGADIAGILHSCENDEERCAGGRGCAEKVVERGGTRLHEGGDALGMLGVGKTFKKAISGTEQRECDFRPVNERSEVLMMALAGFAEKDGFNATAGAEGLFDESDSFDADGPGFGREAAAEGHAKGLEPAVAPADENRRCA
jgi:hypothetical protein